MYNGFGRSVMLQHFGYERLTIIVDICITTPMKALERVCLLAKALADRTHSLSRSKT